MKYITLFSIFMATTVNAEPVYEPKPYIGISGYNNGAALTLGAELNEYFSLESALVINEKVKPSVSALIGMEYGYVRPYVVGTIEYNDGWNVGGGIGSKIHYSSKVNFDLRYTYIDENRFYAGIEYRF